jgi:hypothetical protein
MVVLVGISHKGDVVVGLTWSYWLELIMREMWLLVGHVVFVGIIHAGDVVVGFTWWYWLVLVIREMWLLVSPRSM